MKADKHERTQSVASFANDLGLDFSTSDTKTIVIRERHSFIKNLRKRMCSIGVAFIDFDLRRIIKPASYIVLAGAVGYGAWHIWPDLKTKSDSDLIEPVDSVEIEPVDSIFDIIEVVEPDTADLSPATHSDVSTASPVKPEKVVAAEETKPTNDELYAKAQTLSDYKRLADNGYRKAYANLADLYLKQRDYKSADTYVRKAFAARSNLALATSVADMLDKLGWYDDPKNGSKPQ
jgi:hypothetical protein